MAGLGSPASIWRWPYHYYMAVRAEFIKVMSGAGEADEPSKGDIRVVAPGVTEERFKY